VTNFDKIDNKVDFIKISQLKVDFKSFFNEKQISGSTHAIQLINLKINHLPNLYFGEKFKTIEKEYISLFLHISHS
jgi:hypothetical protein